MSRQAHAHFAAGPKLNYAGCMLPRRATVLSAALMLCVIAPLPATAGPRDPAEPAAQDREAPVGDRTEITFSGFQTFPDGSSRLFVRLTGKPRLTKNTSERTVIFLMENTFVGVRNNKNPLDVSHFQTPLLRAQLVEKGADVQLVMQLRKAAKQVLMQHRFTERSDDSYSLQIDLPAPGP